MTVVNDLFIGTTPDGHRFSLPPEAVTQTFALLAKRGSGKTYTASVLVEELLKAGLPTVVVDPVGVLWGLRASADGKGPGLPIVIIGGDHGDAPLEASSGETIAELIVDEGLSVVLDLSLLRKGEQVHFMTDFAERLYHRNRRALHLVLDEADAFAPQRPLPGQQRLLGAIEDLVRRGRARGLGVTLITQRPAVLHKDVLTQVEVLVTLRLIAPQDRAAIDEWVKVHGTPEQREQLMASLPSLPIGTAWFWSPGWLNTFERVAIRRRETFDSSATPKVGEVVNTPRKLAPVDLEALRTRLATTIEKAKAEDPKLLRGRIAELERELKARPSGTKIETKVERVEVPVIRPNHLDELVRAVEAMRGMLSHLGEQVDRISGETARMIDRFAAPPPIANRPKVAALATPTASVVTTPIEMNGARLSKAERSILTALAQYAAGRTRTQVAILTGYAVNGGGFGNAISALRTKGWLEGGKDEMRITDAGRAGLGTWEPLPTGRALVEYWMGQLSKAERLILEVLVDAYPATRTKEQVAEATGYAPDGGGFGNALSRLRTLELIAGGKGDLRASAHLVEA